MDLDQGKRQGSCWLRGAAAAAAAAAARAVLILAHKMLPAVSSKHSAHKSSTYPPKPTDSPPNQPCPPCPASQPAVSSPLQARLAPLPVPYPERAICRGKECRHRHIPKLSSASIPALSQSPITFSLIPHTPRPQSAPRASAAGYPASGPGAQYRGCAGRPSPADSGASRKPRASRVGTWRVSTWLVSTLPCGAKRSG